VASTARDLLHQANELANRMVEPDAATGSAAVTALGHTARALSVLDVSRTGVERAAAVSELASACRAAEGEWAHQPGRLVDLVGAASDLLRRTSVGVSGEEAWAVAVEFGESARRCVEVALRYGPYTQVPSLSWVHDACCTVERLYARHAGTAVPGRVLDVAAPAVYPSVRGAAGLIDATAALCWSVRADLSGGAVPVRAALAGAAAAELLAEACLVHSASLDGPWRHTGQAWKVLYAALARFHDDHESRHAQPVPAVQATVRVERAVAELQSRRSTADAVTRSADTRAVQLIARSLPRLARQLEHAVDQWGQRRCVYARARTLARSEELVPAIIADTAVLAGPIELIPVTTAVRVAQRLSCALAHQLTGEPAHDAQLDPRSLDQAAGWAARLAQRVDQLATR
jgi:hypothetical protein